MKAGVGENLGVSQGSVTGCQRQEEGRELQGAGTAHSATHGHAHSPASGFACLSPPVCTEAPRLSQGDDGGGGTHQTGRQPRVRTCAAPEAVQPALCSAPRSGSVRHELSGGLEGASAPH